MPSTSQPQHSSQFQDTPVSIDCTKTCFQWQYNSKEIFIKIQEMEQKLGVRKVTLGKSRWQLKWLKGSIFSFNAKPVRVIQSNLCIG